MKIHTVIDFEDGRDYCCTMCHDFDNRDCYTSDPRMIGRVVFEYLVGYLEAKMGWEAKSDIEQMLLLAHDKKKGYRGAAPAGDPEKPWRVTKHQYNNPLMPTIIVPLKAPGVKGGAE